MKTIMRMLWCLLGLLALVGAGAADRQAFAPLARTAAESATLTRQALAAGRCFATEVKYGGQGSVVRGSSEQPLAPGRYRAHVLLAMGPIGDIAVSAISVTVSAGEHKRQLTMLHFPRADEFIDVPVEFTVDRAGDVAFTVEWALTGDRAKFNHDQAARARPVTGPDEDEEGGEELGAVVTEDQEGMIAVNELRQLPYHLAACGAHFELLSPVAITRTAADKIVYKPGEQGTATVTLHNAGAAPAQAVLVVELQPGVEGSRPVARETLTLAAGETKTWTGAFDTAGLAWGADLRATATVGAAASTRRFSFGVTKNPWETALVAGMMFSRDYREPEAAERFMQRYMDQGFTSLESGFWAPDEFGDFTPDPVIDTFFGGQHCYPGSVKGSQNVIKAGHKRGMACTVYANLWGGDGYDGWEMIRQHPDWIVGGSATYADMIENWDLMFRGKLQMACWPYICNRGGAADAFTLPVHARELVNTKREIGWDGVRYDSYDAEGEWNINCTETVRRLVEKDEPDYMWGYNSSVPKNITPRALEVMCRGGALVMEEGLRGAGREKSSITGYLTALSGFRDKVWHYGGQMGICYDRPMATLTYGGSVVDEMYLSASLLASGAHPYYGVIENTIGQFPRFALRYSEYLFNSRMRSLAAPEAVISVPPAAKLLCWQRLAKTVTLDGERRRMVVHLINAPVNDFTQQNLAMALPAPLRNLPVTLTLPAGAKVAGAWALYPIPDAGHTAVPVKADGGKLVATVPEVRVYTVLVVDFTAKDGLPTIDIPATGKFPAPQPEQPKPPVVPEPDDAIAAQKGVAPPAEWIFPAARPQRVLATRGVWYPQFGLDRAFAHIGGALVTDAWASVGAIRYYPESYEGLMRHHLVVVSNVSGPAYGPVRRAMLKRYVEAGGAVLFLGGANAYTGYQQTAFADIAPVLFDAKPNLRHAPDGLLLATGKDALKGFAAAPWAQAPRVFWHHELAPKPEAKVLLTAGGKPLLVAGTFGKGRVAVFTGSVMGDPAKGLLPFWEWDGWPVVIGETMRWLTEPTRVQPPPGAELLAKIQRELLGDGVKKADKAGPVIARWARVPATPATAQLLLQAIANLDGDVPIDLADTVWDTARPCASADSAELAAQLREGAAGAKVSLGLRILGQIKADDARSELESAFKEPGGGGPDDGEGLEDSISEDPAYHAYIVRLGALEGLGNLADPKALPVLQAAVKQYRRLITKSEELSCAVTQDDELYQEAVLSALRCGDAAAAGPVVDMLLENRYVTIRMMSYLDSPDYPGPEHEPTRREKKRIRQELPRVYARQARLYAKLAPLPTAVLPALAQRLAAEDDPRVAPIAAALFGDGFRAAGPLPADVVAALKTAKVAAVRALAGP